MLSLVTATCFERQPGQPRDSAACSRASGAFRSRALFNECIFRRAEQRAQTWILGGRSIPTSIRASDERLRRILLEDHARLTGGKPELPWPFTSACAGRALLQSWISDERSPDAAAAAGARAQRQLPEGQIGLAKILLPLAQAAAESWKTYDANATGLVYCQSGEPRRYPGCGQNLSARF